MAAIAVRELGEHSDASRGSRLRKALAAAVTTAAGIALLSCSAPQPPAVHSSTGSTVHEPSAPISRAPLSPPVGYAPSPLVNSEMPSASYGASPYEAADPDAARFALWRASPRWAAVKGDGCIVVEQVPGDKLAAPAEAAKFRVENCSQEDVDETNPTQVGGFRNY